MKITYNLMSPDRFATHPEAYEDEVAKAQRTIEEHYKQMVAESEMRFDHGIYCANGERIVLNNGDSAEQYVGSDYTNMDGCIEITSIGKPIPEVSDYTEKHGEDYITMMADITFRQLALIVAKRGGIDFIANRVGCLETSLNDQTKPHKLFQYWGSKKK